MPRLRRHYKSLTCYEICFRAREGLPFVANRLIRQIIKSAIARTQRDSKVRLCHHIWNGSHCHIIIVSLDVVNLKRFYEEIQKRITDSLKRLLGLKYLSLWEKRPSVVELADCADVMERIAYLYANPAQDDLEDSIERFPGYSSWSEYQGAKSILDSCLEEKVAWIRMPALQKLDSSVLSATEELLYLARLKRRCKTFHSLVHEPNAWMKAFGIETDKEASAINAGIIEQVREREEGARLRREEEGKSVLGRSRLLAQPILSPHVPKKKERKIYFFSRIKEIRLRLIEEMRRFCEVCEDCYLAWKVGDLSVVWPDGAFRPSMPPLVNPLPGFG